MAEGLSEYYPRSLATDTLGGSSKPPKHLQSPAYTQTNYLEKFIGSPSHNDDNLEPCASDTSGISARSSIQQHLHSPQMQAHTIIANGLKLPRLCHTCGGVSEDLDIAHQYSRFTTCHCNEKTNAPSQFDDIPKTLSREHHGLPELNYNESRASPNEVSVKTHDSPAVDTTRDRSAGSKHNTSVRVPDRRRGLSKYLCGRCMNNFSDKKELSDHEILHKNAPEAGDFWTCNHCNYRFPRRIGQQHHRRSCRQNKPQKVPENSVVATLYCDTCRQNYPGEVALRRHKLWAGH